MAFWSHFCPKLAKKSLEFARKYPVESCRKSLHSREYAAKDSSISHHLLFASRSYSSKDSGSIPIPASPADFFCQYLLTQASQLFPAAVSRPEKASAAISE